MPPKACLICERKDPKSVRQNGAFVVTCKQCGRYLINVGQAHIDADPEDLPLLSCAARQASESGSTLRIDHSSIPRLIAAHKGTSVTRNLEKLLQFLGRRAKHPSDAIDVYSESDFTVIDTDEPADVDVYLDWLEKDDLIKIEPNVDFRRVILTHHGWQRLQTERVSGGKPGTCFVAMSFDPSMIEAFELGVLPAVETDCGFTALRVDRKEHNNQITDEIMAGIRSAELTIADFTGHRAGVYYEAGFARGLGREVIYCCRENDFKERHFDTSVMNHVVWTDPTELRTKLANRIRATILPKA